VLSRRGQQAEWQTWWSSQQWRHESDSEGSRVPANGHNDDGGGNLGDSENYEGLRALGDRD